MAKKFSLLMAAAAVLAFAVPAFANAATGLTQSAGVLVPTGKVITGTNTGEGFITTARTGTIKCASGAVMVEALLKENSSTTVKAVTGGTPVTSTCATPTGGVAKVKNVQLKELDTKGGGTGTGTIFFELELPGGAVCVYEGVNDAGTYSPTETAAGGNIISFSEQPVTLISGACGSTKIDGKFSIATQGTTTKVFLM